MPTTWQSSPVGRFLRASYGLSYHDWYGLKSRCALLARTARLRLQAAGLPLKRQFLIVRCRDGSEALGLFSEFATVLGALEHYERWARQYAGLRVDFGTRGLYHDSAVGTNWWEYYFDPIEIGSSEGAAKTEVTAFRLDLFSNEGLALSRQRGFELIGRYVRPAPRICDEVESHVREHFKDAFVVGIHYRGTDKSEEAVRVPYEQVRAAVVDTIDTAKPARWKLFVATDEQAFLDYMRAKFPDALTYRRIFRSVDGRAIDVVNEDSSQKKGEDAVIDCLLLSRCQYLIRTESNLGACSALFNPGLPQIRLNRAYHSSSEGAASGVHSPSGRKAFRQLPGNTGAIEVPHLEIHVTHKCNLTCEGCLHFTNHRHAGTLSIEDLRKSMSLWNKRLIPKMFALLGGEPCLHRDLADVVYMTREMWPDPRTSMELVSNGLLLHLHPDLPSALADTATSLSLSIHSNGSISPRYQEKISRSLDLVRRWQREYGIEVTTNSAVSWIRGYDGFGNDMMPFEDNNPRKSWDNCVTGQQCFQLFEDRLWKCAPLAYLKLQDRKFELSEKWKPYLGYEPLVPGCTDEEIVEFFDRKAESACGMCPSNPQVFTKRDPLLPVRFYKKQFAPNPGE